jgi:ComEC/Rec2-related protein
MGYKILVYAMLPVAFLYASYFGRENGYSGIYCHNVFNRLVQKLDKTSEYSPLYSYILFGCVSYGQKVDADIKKDFISTSTVHLISISGLHIAVIINVFYLVLNIIIYVVLVLLGRKDRIFFPYSLVCALVLSTLYVFQIGAEVPRLRSIIMAVLAGVAVFYPVIRDKFLILSVAAAVVLFTMPGSYYSISFYYSFGAVLAIYLSPRKSLFCMSLYVYLLTLPISLYLNGSISAVHLLANLIMVPFFSYVFFPTLMLTVAALGLGVDFHVYYLDCLSRIMLAVLHFLAGHETTLGLKTFLLNRSEVLFLYALILLFYMAVRYFKSITPVSAAIIYGYLMIIAVLFAVYFEWNYSGKTIITASKISTKTTSEILRRKVRNVDLYIKSKYSFKKEEKIIRFLKDERFRVHNVFIWGRCNANDWGKLKIYCSSLNYRCIISSSGC